MLPADKHHLDTLAHAIRFGLDLCHQAVQSSRNLDTLDLIHLQIKNLRRVDAALESLALRLGLLFADEPTHHDLSRLEAIEVLTGRRFDQAWMAEMVNVYDTMIDAAESLILYGSETQIRHAAEQVVAVVRPHRNELRQAMTNTGQRPSRA